MDLTEEREVIDAAELEFECMSCQHRSVVDVFQFKTTDKLFGVMSVWTTYETSLMCPNCNTTFRTKVGLDALRNLKPRELGSRFMLRIELVEKFLVVAGWLLLITGPVAFILFLIARFMLPKAPSGWRTMAGAGLIVSGIVTGLFLVGALLGL